MNNLVASVFLVGAVTVTAIAGTGAKDRIRVVVDKNYPPYSFGTAEQAGGLYTRLIEEVFSRCGIRAEIKALPWKDALEAGEAGSAAVGGIYKTKARMKIYDYSEPIFEERLVVYVKKGRSFPFTRLADLQGRTIGLNRAWSYGDEFDAARKEFHFTVEEADSNTDNFKKLLRGRIDCLVADQVAAAQIIRQQKWGDQVERLQSPVADNPAYLAFAKVLHNRQVLDKFDRALAEMKKDGSYAKLIQDFVGAAPEHRE